MESVPIVGECGGHRPDVDELQVAGRVDSEEDVGRESAQEAVDGNAELHAADGDRRGGMNGRASRSARVMLGRSRVIGEAWEMAQAFGHGRGFRATTLALGEPLAGASGLYCEAAVG
jgi:hypothetical protein